MSIDCCRAKFAPWLPCCLLIDEIDGIAPNRLGSNSSKPDPHQIDALAHREAEPVGADLLRPGRADDGGPVGDELRRPEAALAERRRRDLGDFGCQRAHAAAAFIHNWPRSIRGGMVAAIRDPVE